MQAENNHSAKQGQKTADMLEENITWSTSQEQKLVELYKYMGKKIVKISAKMKKIFNSDSPKFTEQKIKEKIISLIQSGIMMLKNLIQERQEDYIEIPRVMRLKSCTQIAAKVLNSKDGIYLPQKVKLIELDFQTKLAVCQIKRIINVIENSMNTSTSAKKQKKQKKNTKENAQKLNFINLLQQYGNNYDYLRDLIGVTSSNFVRELAESMFLKAIRKLQKLIRYYYDQNFQKFPSDLARKVSKVIVSQEMKYDQNKKELRQQLLYFLKCMHSEIKITKKHAFYTFKLFTWVRENMLLTVKKNEADEKDKQQWTLEEEKRLCQIYSGGKKFSEISRQLQQQFKQSIPKFKGRRIQFKLTLLIKSGIEALTSLMQQRYNQFTEFYYGMITFEMADKMLRSRKGVTFQHKRDLIMLNINKQITKQNVQQLIRVIKMHSQLYLKKTQNQLLIKKKVRGMIKNQKSKYFNLMDDGIQICEFNHMTEEVRHFSWTQQQQKAIYDLYMKADGNRFAEVSKKLNQMFPNQKFKFRITRVQSKLSTLIRSGMQTLKCIIKQSNSQMVQDFCQGKNFQKATKILRSNKPQFIDLKKKLIKLNFEKTLPENQIQTVIKIMCDFEKDWKEYLIRRAIKIQVKDDGEEGNQNKQDPIQQQKYDANIKLQDKPPQD